MRVDNDGIFVFTPATFVQPAGWPAIEKASRADEHLAPGVDFQRWRLVTATGPLSLSIVRTDLREPRVKLTVASRNDAILGPGEALSTMAERHSAVAGINADYYDISGTGSPTNLVLENGTVQHAPNGRAVLMVSGDNQVSMGPVEWQMDFTGTDGAITTVKQVNEWSPGTQITVFTQRFGLPGYANADAEVVLVPTGDGRYQVSKTIADQPTFWPLRPDDLGIAARGEAAVALLHAFHEGDVIGVQQRWSPALPDAHDGVGGGPLLLRGGEPFEDPNAPSPEERDVRYPLTGAGTSSDGATLWLVTVDGRAPGRSIGITRPMLGALFAALGASDAMAFDSGGSTEMVIRRLGDPDVTVANVPSDGRERSIADGLFVQNSATPGPLAHIVLRAPAQAVLVGSHLAVAAEGVDANDQPVAAGSALRFAVDPSDVATIDASGVLEGKRAGEATISAESGGMRGELRVAVVPRIARLAVAPLERAYPESVRFQLAVNAATAQGAAIAVDPSVVQWSSSGSGGSVEADGAFRTAATPSRALVVARAGDSRAEAAVLVGAHHTMLQTAMRPGALTQDWHLVAAPKELPAALNWSAAPDGSQALHLSYDFGGISGTRAAFAVSEIPVSGEPLVLSLEVYGDSGGAWLRAAYRNADGINDSVTFARRIEWTGWKTLVASIPVQARWPLTITKVYVVAPPGAEKQAGDLWFRSLGAWYPGP